MRKPAMIAAMVAGGLLLSVPRITGEDNAFESQEFDFWMYQVCCVAPQFQFQVDCNDDTDRDWFWLYYFLEGKNPQQAIIETQAYDAGHPAGMAKPKSYGRDQ